MFNDMKPVNGNILVKDTKQKTKTRGGLFLPETRMADQVVTGTIQGLSKPWTDKKGNQREINFVEKGDLVLYKFTAGAGNAFEIDGKLYRLIREEEILAKLDE